ncbi:hypothetical protein POM88_007265 [Heracleum sosnowskyi]|uniref:Uncharacterized protein n=1 Tax=Heracleum sosnowskyi TaxID=360622 RepID=A0AAD8J4A0_9APIA|nr:hypothetical protein POM88_007265 [Heracleum sosnowskyi]
MQQFDNKARKTLLGTIRNHWPEGVYQYRDINARYPNWLDDICDEFKNYYTHKKGQSSSEADWSIELHVKNTCKRLITDEKYRFKNKKAKTGLWMSSCAHRIFIQIFGMGCSNFGIVMPTNIELKLDQKIDRRWILCIVLARRLLKLMKW